MATPRKDPTPDETPEQTARKVIEQERATRVAVCQARLLALLDEHRCTLTVQGQYVQPINGGPRQETAGLVIVALD